ncbi:hypothetical protein BDV18DRAFT_163881 [Aspergillus unguis]
MALPMSWGKSAICGDWLRNGEYAWNTRALVRERWEHVYKNVNPEHQVFRLDLNVHKSVGS